MNTITIEPEPSNKVLTNPGMGWTTFYSFNGEEINASQPDSSIAYFRLYWDDLEPQEGDYRWDAIDNLIEIGKKYRQKLAFRISAMDGMEEAAVWREKIYGFLGTRPSKLYRVPKWFYELGCEGALFKDKYAPQSPEMWEPDYGDPLFLEKHGNFISAFGKRYNGHPDIDHIDLGSFGRWGEWHVAAVKMPALEKRKRIVDMYLEAFTETPLLMLVSGEQCLEYAISKGAGWRADCLGDMRDDFFNEDVAPSRMWNHMEDYYLQHLIAANALHAWKKAPVAFECGWWMGYWYEQGWSIDYILAYALSLHVSILNNKSLAIPEKWKHEIDEFTKKMGYRIVLEKLEYPAKFLVQSDSLITMRWLNKGVAPCYGTYALIFKLKNIQQQNEIKLKADFDIRKLLPGTKVIHEHLHVPIGFPKGMSEISLAFVDEKTFEPAIKIAISGADHGGWFAAGKVEVI